MSKSINPVRWIGLLCVLSMLCGCATKQVGPQDGESPPAYWQDLPEVRPTDRPPISPKPAQPPKRGKKDLTLVKRAVTEKELRGFEQKDPDLHFERCLEILSRLNGKDREYIRDDIKHKRVLTIPKSFASYLDWSPLPATINGIGHLPKFILVVKDICFLGWYDRGKLIGDTYICIGKMPTWTKRGMYRIKEKDPSHMSTYPNAYGAPSLMPHAMRIYDRVWIHAGDVIGRNCSRGCINVPLYTSGKLYFWTDMGTPVLVIESLKDLGRDMSAVPTPPNPQPAKVVKPSAKKDSLKDIY